VVKFTQQRNFTDGRARDAFIAVLDLDFLQSNALKVQSRVNKQFFISVSKN
jgi:hypothetical protein